MAACRGTNIRMIRESRALQSFLVLAVIIGNTRIARAQEEKSKKHHEIPYKMTISMTPPGNPRCEAQLLFTYIQYDTVARVDSKLTNTDCAASSGDYTIRVRFRDENNELRSLEYPETWRRDDDQPIELSKDYVIGENVDLVSVRSRKLQCICDAAGEQEETPED